MRSPKQTRPVHVDELRMDLRVEEIIEQPYASVQKALLADPGKWLPSLANDAWKRLITELAVRIGSARVARAVEVEVAPPRSTNLGSG
jgi:hypothetical protein